jgi:hypothetical protein
MTNLSQTLFRVDPTEGFVQYVNTVKPYHSKILDVLIEYVHTETLTAHFQESIEFTLNPVSAPAPAAPGTGVFGVAGRLNA